MKGSTQSWAHRALGVMMAAGLVMGMAMCAEADVEQAPRLVIGQGASTAEDGSPGSGGAFTHRPWQAICLFCDGGVIRRV